MAHRRQEAALRFVGGVGGGARLLGLVEKPRVLQRHRHAAGQRFEQAYVGFGEGVLGVQVLHGDGAQRLPLHPQRQPDARLGRLAAPRDFTEFRHALGHAGIDEQGLAGFPHVRGKAAVIGRLQALDNDAPAALDDVGDAHQTAVTVVDAHAHALGIEGLADRLAHQVVDGLHLQLGGQGGLHAVDDSQLGRTLLGLRLGRRELRAQVEELRHLRVHAHAARYDSAGTAATVAASEAGAISSE